jgi:uncharacterized protein (TIGR02246 family)
MPNGSQPARHIGQEKTAMISPEDEAAIRQLAADLGAAWNRHGGDALAEQLTPGADFVHVRGGWLGGREAFRKYIVSRHATQFKNSVHTNTGMTIRPLTPDICVVHLTWTNSGDTDLDGTPRQPREGIQTWIVRRIGEKWPIDVAHNTNIDTKVVGPEHRKPTSLRETPNLG